jgi:hypothetical protein
MTRLKLHGFESSGLNGASKWQIFQRIRRSVKNYFKVSIGAWGELSRKKKKMVQKSRETSPSCTQVITLCSSRATGDELKGQAGAVICKSYNIIIIPHVLKVLAPGSE